MCEPEAVPEEDHLFMRVSKKEILSGQPIPGVFRNRASPDGIARPGMSTDWCKYSTAEDARARSLQHPPDYYGVIFFVVGQVRAMPLQVVEHTPWCNDPELAEAPNNPAHTDIFGPKSERDFKAQLGCDGSEARKRSLEVRTDFQTLSRWAIPPPE
jgi:hypothetical protein